MLIAHGSVGRMRKHFADQFEADGEGYLYRRLSKGSPVRVSAAERDAFVDAFARSLRRATTIVFAGSLLLGLLLAGLTLGGGIDLPDWTAGAAVAGLVGFAGWLPYRAYMAPAHALRSRLPVGPERSGAQMRGVALQRMRWSQLGLGVAGCVMLLTIEGPEWRTTAGKLWIAFASGVLVLLLVQAWRKRRLKR